MQTFLQQNRRLHQIMQKCEQQIIDLKKTGQDHEQQIDNLLKFNQRLLSIIENQIPNKVLSCTSSGSNLHPIDETNEKEHEVVNIPQRFVAGHAQHSNLKDRVEHVEVEEVQRLSEEEEDEEYKKHVNLPLGDAKQQSDFARYRNADNYEHKKQRPELSSGRNSNDQYLQNVIYREEKESLIDIPKFFKFQKGLNEHYQQQLFQSVEEFGPQLRNSNNSSQSSPISQFPLRQGMISPPALNRLSPLARKQSIPSQSSEMNKISEAVTERLLISEDELREEFEMIRQLIAEYKEDFDTQEYTHLCTIIKNDLENDMKELMGVNNESLKFYIAKEKELARLKTSISQFSPVQKLIQIVRKLKISEDTERMILNKVAPNYHQNGVRMNGSLRK